MAELFVNIRSHHFVCRPTSAMARNLVVGFKARFQQLGMPRKMYGRVERKVEKEYAAKCADRTEMRFHRNVLAEFKKHIEFARVGENFTQWVEDPIPEPVEVELIPREFKLGTDERLELREDDMNAQISAVNYFLEGDAPTTKLVGVQTGKGKGIISMFALGRLGVRPFITVLPQYVVKWCDELVEVLDIDRMDIMVIRTGKDLMAFTQLCKEGLLDCKIVIIASTIFRGWMTVYEQLHYGISEIGYAFMPDEFMGQSGCGVRVTDEVHREFHNFFKIDLYTHCQHIWSMSATLRSKDPFMMRMFEIGYPSNWRFKGLAYDKYVNYTAVTYRFDYPDKIRFTERGRTEYSHNVFEESILKQPQVLKNYLTMINIYLQAKYFQKKTDAEECAVVFAASIDMCTAIAKYLQVLYPDLDIRRYAPSDGDPKANLFESDICVTTIGAGGTGHDIKNLIAVIMTTAIDSEAANLQAMGRLRKLRSGKTPEFVYLVNSDNEKHLNYHENKIKLLDGVALHLLVTPYHPLL
jgi:hypothetical protein